MITLILVGSYTDGEGRGEEGVGSGQKTARILLPAKLQCCGGEKVKRVNTSRTLQLDKKPESHSLRRVRGLVAAAFLHSADPSEEAQLRLRTAGLWKGDDAHFPTFLRVTSERIELRPNLSWCERTRGFCRHLLPSAPTHAPPALYPQPLQILGNSHFVTHSFLPKL